MTRDAAGTLLGQTMGLVAVTAGAEAVRAGAGATLVHVYPDDDEEAAAFAAAGFIEVPGFLVRLIQPA